MNKKGFIENWTGFIILTAVGLVVVLLAMKMWSAQDFEMNTFTKIAMVVMCPVAAAFFTKIWLED